MLLLTIGLLGSLALRPHVAAMLSVSMLLPFALSKNRRGMSGIFAKAFIAPLLIAASFYLTWKAQDFLEMKDYQQATNVLRQVGQDNSFGNSTFNVSASLPARVAAAPLLFFRPFPWEARSLQGIIAAGEGLLLLWLTWKRRKYLWPAVRRWRENAFRAFLLLFLIEFSLVYSAAITNFGLLARERVMALPLLLMLIWLMPAEAAERTQNAAVSRFLNLRYSPGIVQSHTISQQSGSYPGGNS
jgi:hypothetical protein